MKKGTLILIFWYELVSIISSLITGFVISWRTFGTFVYYDKISQYLSFNELMGLFVEVFWEYTSPMVLSIAIIALIVALIHSYKVTRNNKKAQD